MDKVRTLRMEGTRDKVRTLRIEGITLVPWAARPGSRSHYCAIVQVILFYKQSSWLS